MNKFKNKYVIILAILVIILGIIIFNNKDGISELIGINRKDVFESKSNTENICKKKSYYLGVYLYNDTVSSDTDGYCITGKEETCIETECYKDKSVGACPAGTIVHYYVNTYDINSQDVYFNVLHDDGETMTLQSVNAITQSTWGNQSTTLVNIMPTDVLSAITSATSTWTNVNDLTYTLGETIFLKYPNNSSNKTSYTICKTYNSCSKNYSNLSYKNVKSRIISLQEAVDLGCTNTSGSCPKWMNKTYAYWTLTLSEQSTSAGMYGYTYIIYNKSVFCNNNNLTKGTYPYDAMMTKNKNYVYAVIEINK
jgi:hypothetical protein